MKYFLCVVLFVFGLQSKAAEKKAKTQDEKTDQIITMLEDLNKNMKINSGDVKELKTRMYNLEQDVEMLKKIGVARIPSPVVREYSAYYSLDGKVRVDESVAFGIKIAKGTKGTDGKEPVQEAVVEVKNTWTTEVVLILNGGKHKIPAKETLSFKIKPGDFTYQIQDITGKITRTIHMGDKYGIVVRSTEDNKPPKEVPIPVKKTSTLVFESQVKDNTTVVINGKQYDIPSGKTISIDVSVGKCEMHVLGFSQTTTTDCAAGGSYAFAIKLAKNYNTTQPPTTYRPTYQFPIDRSYQRCR